MSGQDSKLLIKIGKHFEANASGKSAIVAVVIIVLTMAAWGLQLY